MNAPIELEIEIFRQFYEVASFFTCTHYGSYYKALKTLFIVLFAIPYLAMKLPVSIALIVYQAICFSICRAFAVTIILAPVGMIIGLLFGIVNIVLIYTSRAITYVFNVTDKIASIVA